MSTKKVRKYGKVKCKSRHLAFLIFFQKYREEKRMDVLKITMSVALRKMIQVTPAGIVLSHTLDLLDELMKEKELEHLRDGFTGLRDGLLEVRGVLVQHEERLDYLEKHSSEISYEFSASMDNADMDKFVEKLSAYNIPLEGLDFYNDMDGISIHLSEDNPLSEYEIGLVAKKLDELLKEIGSDISITSAYRIDENVENVKVQI